MIATRSFFFAAAITISASWKKPLATALRGWLVTSGIPRLIE
jgi:hypothetical protein